MRYIPCTWPALCHVALLLRNYVQRRKHLVPAPSLITTLLYQPRRGRGCNRILCASIVNSTPPGSTKPLSTYSEFQNETLPRQPVTGRPQDAEAKVGANAWTKSLGRLSKAMMVNMLKTESVEPRRMVTG